MIRFSVLIPDGESVFAIKVLKCLSKEMGVKVFVLSNNPSAAVAFSRFTKKIFTYTEKNDSDRLNAITAAIAKTNADVVLPVDVKTIRLLSANIEKIKNMCSVASLAVIDSIDIADDKWLTFEWLKKNNITTPETLLLQDTDNLQEKAKNLHFPVLVKPRKGSGGMGIEKFDNKNLLFKFWNDYASKNSAIIQSFIRGFDIDCSFLCHEGEILAYTIQKRFVYSEKPVAGELGIDFIYHEQTVDVVKEFARKLDWSGIGHIDLRFDEDDGKVKIIEINPRYWATVPESLFAGVNFPYIACLHALRFNTPEVKFVPKRIIQLRSAIKITLQKLIHRNRKDLFFDNIYLNRVTLNDPFPFLQIKFPWLSFLLRKKSTQV
ncbi:MAG: ATP-grasp domain-containing protein [Ginsengibacter sp.]